MSSLHGRNTNELPTRVKGSVFMGKVNFNGDTVNNRFVNSYASAIYFSKMVLSLNLSLDLFSLFLASDLGNFPFHHDAPAISLLLEPV